MIEARPLRKPCLLLKKELMSEEPPGDIGAFKLGEPVELVVRLLEGTDMSGPTDNRFGIILFNFGDILLVAEFKELFSFGSYVLSGSWLEELLGAGLFERIALTADEATGDETCCLLLK